MSRSFKHEKYFGNTTAGSEKWDKRAARKKWRKRTKQTPEGEEYYAPELRECSDSWVFKKDGKKWWGDAERKDMRK